MKMKKVLSAGIMGLALATSSVAGSAIAEAQEGQVITGSERNDVSGKKIDVSQPISLTVKKTGHNPYDDSQSGNSGSEGVSFDLYRVRGVDVTNDSVRKKVMDKYSYEYITHHNMTQIKVQDGVTDTKGFVSFTGLKPGLYVLKQAGVNTSPEVIMLPMVDANGLEFHYDNLIVTKNFEKTPPPETTTPPPSETTTPPPETTPAKEHPSQNTPASTQETPPPSSSTTPPPPADDQTPVFPGGPTVNTGGVAIPSLSGQGNMSIATMIAFLVAISGVGYMVYRFLSSRIKEEE